MSKKSAANRAAQEVELNKFIAKRDQIKQKIRRFSHFLENMDRSKLSELKVRVQAVEPLMDQFDDILVEINLLDENIDCQRERDNFDLQFYKALGDAKNIISDLETNDSLNNSNQSVGVVAGPVGGVARLPKLELPKFKGEFEKWPQFFDAFQTLVNNNTYLDNIQKFYYLLDCLEGEARKILDCLEVTNSNYITALDLLKKRYENKPVIIQAHLKALVDMPSLQKESFYHLRNVGDAIEKHTRALRNLGEPVDSWDRLLIYLISRKLDVDTSKEWEQKTITDFNGEPKLLDFTNFLYNKSRILETVHLNIKQPKILNRSGGQKGFQVTYAVTENVQKSIKCEMCKGSHFVYVCDKLLGLPIQERANEVKKLKLCFNCLRSSHKVNECRLGGCRKCGGRHNTILHLDPNPVGNNTYHNIRFDDEESNKSSSKIQDNSHNEVDDQYPLVTATSYSNPKQSFQCLLSTAEVYIKNSNNDFVKCRALLDNGSQINFITQELANKLNLKLEKVNLPVLGVNKMTTNITYRTHTTIKSCYNNYNVDISFMILDKVTVDIPVRSFEKSCLNIPPNIKLADPNFSVSSKIDILLGVGVFYELLCAGQIKLGNHLPVLQKTLLGWLVSGPFYGESSDNNVVSCHLTINNNIQNELERFWNVEECTLTKKLCSNEESICEEKFVSTTTRDELGRFCVSLPLKDDVKELGDSLQVATKRFYSLERKLDKNNDFKREYCLFMEQYKELGHMSKIEADDIDSINPIYYLPHHAVVNESSLTTKLRVVFDASAKTSNNISLNDVLLVGPTIQDDLFDILIRFRQFKVVLTADVEKMYRQVRIIPEQRDLQRILWRPNKDADLEHYRLNTVTYGTASASFLATRCLFQIALDIKDSHPETSNVIKRGFYVDDLIVSIESDEKAAEIARVMRHEFNKYGFPLRKWLSNSKPVLEELAADSPEDVGYYITDSDTKKTLGVFWQANSDVLEYVVKLELSNSLGVTKRFILSVISRIFDPLGLVGCVTIRAKVLLQKLWQLSLNWDESIPLELLTVWNQFYRELNYLNTLKISRQCIITDANYVELHGFCDASESSYGCCIYLRSLDASGRVLVKLVCSKSRVAPLKHISIPRLELCAALLLATLTHKCISALDIQVNKVFLWSDSTITLSWIRSESSRWKVFVANRVSEIQSLSNNYQWRHVGSGDNPADVISRGVQPAKLGNLDLWWVGPKWLQLNPDNWPLNNFKTLESLPEERKIILNFANVLPETTLFAETLFSKFSSLHKLVCVIAWCYRFYKNSKVLKEERQHGSLSVTEFNNALLIIIKLMQRQEYLAEITALERSEPLPKNSPIKSLDPFLDSNDKLLRVGGRIRASNENYDTKFQIILPQKHALTRLIILNAHHKHLHAGIQMLLANLRQRYWPINGRNAIRSVLSKCVTCFRIKPLTAKQKMGNLPKDRLKPQRAFSICGVDFTGAFNLKDGKLRNRAIIKGYMCVFVCFITKAVHIELVGDLSTHSFLNCLKRFVSRRGLPFRIYSDNGTNFVGAKNELRDLLEYNIKLPKDKQVLDFCLQNSIEWQCIPPRSPHQGGLWEAAIRSAKYHVLRVVKNQPLTFEELSTVFAQTEAVLNSRPLTPLSADPNDLLALTPGHFLIGTSLKAVPQEYVMETPSNRLTHFHNLQKIVQTFWNRWSAEYLTTLQQRYKWQHPVENIKVGAMVVLKDDNLPPLNWRLGRVVELHPGPDGLTRVVSVRTAFGVVKRAVQKLCVLPVESDNERL